MINQCAVYGNLFTARYLSTQYNNRRCGSGLRVLNSIHQISISFFFCLLCFYLAAAALNQTSVHLTSAQDPERQRVHRDPNTTYLSYKQDFSFFFLKIITPMFHCTVTCPELQSEPWGALLLSLSSSSGT